VAQDGAVGDLHRRAALDAVGIPLLIDAEVAGGRVDVDRRADADAAEDIPVAAVRGLGRVADLGDGGIVPGFDLLAGKAGLELAELGSVGILAARHARATGEVPRGDAEYSLRGRAVGGREVGLRAAWGA